MSTAQAAPVSKSASSKTATQDANTTQVYRIFIKATPEKIWEAITNPEWTQKFGYGLREEYELKKGGRYRGIAPPAMRAMNAPEVVVDGEVLEVDPPRKFVITWRMVMNPELAAEGFTTLTYEIEPGIGGVSRLSVIHDVAGRPGHAAMIAGDKQGPGEGGGWLWILSDLKSVLESGEPMTKEGW